MKEEKVVMYESPEAAEIKTVTGWVSRIGHFWGDNEHMARYDGSTHKLCECGKIVDKGWINCSDCRGKKDLEKYEAMPREPWDGESPLYSDGLDRYLFHGEAWDYIGESDDMGGEITEESLRLIHCEPVYLHQIDTDIWEDELRTDDDSAEVPDAVQVALDALNEAIKAAGPVSWQAGKNAVQLPLGGVAK